MRQNSVLSIQKVLLRLAPGDDDITSAAQQWSHLFGVPLDDLGTGLQFLNARLEFVPGSLEGAEGIESITIGIVGKERLEGIVRRAKERGLWREGTWVGMCGVRWFFDLLGEEKTSSKL